MVRRASLCARAAESDYAIHRPALFASVLLLVVIGLAMGYAAHAERNEPDSRRDAARPERVSHVSPSDREARAREESSIADRPVWRVESRDAERAAPSEPAQVTRSAAARRKAKPDEHSATSGPGQGNTVTDASPVELPSLIPWEDEPAESSEEAEGDSWRDFVRALEGERTLSPVEVAQRAAEFEEYEFAMALEFQGVYDADEAWAHAYPQALKDAIHQHDPQAVLGLFDRNGVLAGFPLRPMNACRTEENAAQSKDYVSRCLRGGLGYVQKRKVEATEPGSEAERKFRREVRNAVGNLAHDAAGVSILEQIMTVEPAPAKLALVDMLAGAEGRDAGGALARRAVFDPAGRVRRAAVEALTERRADDFCDELLRLLRYPWPPAAARAAEALVKTDDKDSIEALVNLLDDPDPRAPFLGDDGRWKVRELVRVNHLRNCFLCHPRSVSEDDLLRRAVPVPGGFLPPPDDREPSETKLFVRADVVFLRQDFSLMLPVEEPGLWPKEQRFDFFVRTRELSPQEIAERTSAPEVDVRQIGVEPAPPASYPQREAVLYALRQLTGDDYGERAEDWRILITGLPLIRSP